MKIIKKLIPTTKYNILSPYAMTPTSITVHNTENDASARNEIANMTNNNVYTSFHFAVDEKEVIQGIPLDRNAFHSGDGSGVNSGNRTSIAIEICRSTNKDEAIFDKCERNAAQLVAQLLLERHWTIDKVKRHKDWSGKNCPRRTMQRGWNRFLNMVREEMNHILITVHCQTYGWLDTVLDGEVAGTTGESKRLEAIKIDGSANFQYQVHCQTYGDMPLVKNGEMAGTVNQSRRIESIRILCDKPIRYRVHQQTSGWSDWVTNGVWCGIKGISKRLEALEIEFI